MSWFQGIVDTCGHIKDEVKRCLGFLKDENTNKNYGDLSSVQTKTSSVPTTSSSGKVSKNKTDTSTHQSVKEKSTINLSLLDDAMTGSNFELFEMTIDETNIFLLAWKQLIAGALGGLVSRTATAPLDRLKIMMQASAGKGKRRITLSEMSKKIIKEGGVPSLWRGNFINCMKVGPESAIRLFMFEKGKSILSGSKPEVNLELYERFIAGANAGIVAQTAIYPMEVIRTRMALAKTGVYKNIFECAMKITKESSGLRGFYRGIIPSLIGIIPNAGIDLCIYETMKQNWLNSHTERPLRPSYTAALFSGGVSSICSMGLCYPFALIRTNLQAETLLPSLRGKNEFQTMKNTFMGIIRDHGVGGLYRGIIPNMMKVVPACSISYMVYEQARNTFGLH